MNESEIVRKSSVCIEASARQTITKSSEQITYGIPVLVNGTSVIENGLTNNSAKAKCNSVYDVDNNEMYRMEKVKTDGKKQVITSKWTTKNSGLIKHHIVLIGDSSITGCLERISESLGVSYSVLGINKPNANLEAITSSTSFNTDKFTKNDVIIVCGGSRDVGKNETCVGLRHLSQLVKRTSNTNHIILDVPYRFDLACFSCVNKDVPVFKRKLHKLMKCP
jgi:hypothetical protein